MFGKKTWKIVFEQTQNVNVRRMFLHRTAADAREEAVDYTADGQEPGVQGYAHSTYWCLAPHLLWRIQHHPKKTCLTIHFLLFE
jgi:hypothetical protein